MSADHLSRWASCALLLVLLWPRPGSAQKTGSLGFLGGPFITIEWDPSPDPEVAGYIVYIGTTSRSYFNSFDVGNRTAFVYPSAKLNQRHYFAVASYDASRHIGPPSDEVSGVGRLLPPTAYFPFLPGVTTPAGTGTSVVAQTLGCTPSSQCYRTTGVTSRAAAVNALASAPNATVWFIENSRAVYAISGNVPPTPALTSRGVQLAGIAVASTFNETHWVYLEEIETLPDGRRELTIARYREVANTLGERAAIITGVPLLGGGTAPFAVDDLGRIYIALPAVDSLNTYDGSILAFEADGATRRDARGVSPILSRGFANPTGLLWDSSQGHLWLSGSDVGSPSELARTPANASPSGTWPVIPESVFPAKLDAVTAGDRDSTENGLTLTITAPGNRVVTIRPGSSRAFEISLTTGDPVVAVAPGPPGTVYAVSRPVGSTDSRIVLLHQP